MLKKLFLIISSVFLIIVSCGAQPLEDVDARIEQLNHSLLHEEPDFLNVALGELPEDSRPKSFIVKRNFHRESRRILSFIDLLLAHSDQEECRRVLDQVCEIYFLQFHRFIGALAVDPTTNVQMFFPTQNFSTPGNVEGKDQNEQQIRLLKARLREILYNIYDCQNISSTHLQYTYESLPLGLIMTKAIIQIFRTRSQSWRYEKKVDYLSQQLEGAEKKLWLAIADSKEKNLVLSHVPTDSAISSFFNTMKTIMIPRPSHIPWGKLAKFVLSAAAVAGGAFGIYWLVGKLTENVNSLNGAAGNFGTGLGDQIRDAGNNFGEHMTNASERTGIRVLEKLIKGGEDGEDSDGEVSDGNKEKPSLLEKITDVLPDIQETYWSGKPSGPIANGIGDFGASMKKHHGKFVTELYVNHDFLGVYKGATKVYDWWNSGKDDDESYYVDSLFDENGERIDSVEEIESDVEYYDADGDISGHAEDGSEGSDSD